MIAPSILPSPFASTVFGSVTAPKYTFLKKKSNLATESEFVKLALTLGTASSK
jgi:hypothetical protein